MVQAFADESRRGQLYIVAVTIFAPADLHRVRAQLRQLCLRGQRRLHFKTERVGRRHVILASLNSLDIQGRLYLRRGPDNDARAECLTALVSDLIKMSANRLVLESRQDRDQADRRVLRTALADLVGATADGPVYEHMRPSEDPLLWPADALAWCYGAGGDWRRRIMPLVEHVADLDRP